MKKETMTMKQMIFAMVMFILGNTTMIGLQTQVGQDSWICLLMAVAMVIPVVLVYARIMNMYPDKNLFDVMQYVFKPAIGKIMILLMIIYALIMASLVICTFNNFIRMTSLINTPRLAITVSFLFAAMYLALSNMDTFGRGAIVILFILFLTVVITFFMSLEKLDNYSHLFPIANHSLKDLADGAWTVFAKPFAETVLFLGITDLIRRKNNNESPYKSYIYAILISAAILLYVNLRNLLLLGPNLFDNSYFPTHRATRLLGISNFLERIEGLLTYDFIMAGMAKVSICIIFASRGMIKLFGLRDYKILIPPISLMLISICLVGNDNIIQIFDFLNVHKYYAMPFQIIIPLIVWIGAEIKLRSDKKKIEVSQNEAEP